MKLTINEKLKSFSNKNKRWVFSLREIKIIQAMSEKGEFNEFIKEYAINKLQEGNYRIFLNNFIKDLPTNDQTEVCRIANRCEDCMTDSMRIFFIELEMKLITSGINFLKKNTEIKTRRL